MAHRLDVPTRSFVRAPRHEVAELEELQQLERPGDFAHFGRVGFRV